MRKGKLLDEVQAIIRASREEGLKARHEADSRSTGLRRQLQASHHALAKIERLLAGER